MLNKQMSYLFGGFILVLLVVELVPEMFTGLAGWGGVESDVPSWVVTAGTVIVGAGVIFLVYRAFGNK